MIYGDMILENQLEKLTDPIRIMQEYYENEISFLNSVIDYQNECSIVTESTELEALHKGFIETVKNTVKKIIKRFIEFLKRLSNIIKTKFLKKKQNDISEKFDEELKKVEEELEKAKKDEPVEYEIRCFSSELTEKILEFENIISKKRIEILTNLENLVDIINGTDSLLSTSKDPVNEKLNDTINDLNDIIKDPVENIKFSDYIIKYKTDNIFTIKRIFDGMGHTMRSAYLNNIISDIDKTIKKCIKLLSKLDKNSNNDGEADKEKVNKVIKAINLSIIYMQNMSADVIKVYNEYEKLNNKFMQEVLKIKN